jgi:hypothetical protein
LLLVAFTPLPMEFYGPPLVEEDRVWIEEAEAVLASPVDVNSANLESLLAIPWLSPRVAAAILHARDSLGRFESILEVARVPGVDESVLAALVVAARAAPVPVHGRLLVTARSDSPVGGGRSIAALSRLTGGGPAWDATAVAEKDAGETDWADFLGAGVEYRPARARLIAGGYTLASGLGLALSAPGGRSGFAADRDGGAALRLARGVDETRCLRGAGGEFGLGRARVTAALSSARRDAEVREDGSVARFGSGGVHDDSAALARKGQVTEWLGALAARLNMTGWECGACAVASRFSRPVAPADSDYAFTGRNLATAGVYAGAPVGPYRVCGELAGSFPGGGAVAAGIDGAWQDLDVSAAVRWRTDRYFAPHGRWTSLGTRRRRLDVSGRLRYRFAPVSIGLSGSTYRDTDEESLPGRLEAVIEQRAGPLALELRAGRRYDGPAAALSTARLTARLQPAREHSVLASVAYETDPGDGSAGMVAGVRATGGAGAVRFGVSGVRFHIPVGGVRMSWSEPAAGRTGHAFSADSSLWRLAAMVAVDVGFGRIAVSVGQALLDGAEPEVSGQLEVVAQRD